MGNLHGNEKFEIEKDGQKILVSEHTVNDQQIYRLTFDNDRVPLVITRAVTWHGELWTSIPQGRQQEAEEFGKLIADYLKQR